MDRGNTSKDKKLATEDWGASSLRNLRTLTESEVVAHTSVIAILRWDEFTPEFTHIHTLRETNKYFPNRLRRKGYEWVREIHTLITGKKEIHEDAKQCDVWFMMPFLRNSIFALFPAWWTFSSQWVKNNQNLKNKGQFAMVAYFGTRKCSFIRNNFDKSIKNVSD